jgi:hypothetical protein
MKAKITIITAIIVLIRIPKIRLLLKGKIRIKMKVLLSGKIIYLCKLETQKFSIKQQL